MGKWFLTIFSVYVRDDKGMWYCPHVEEWQSMIFLQVNDIIIHKFKDLSFSSPICMFMKQIQTGISGKLIILQVSACPWQKWHGVTVDLIW